MKPDVTVLSGLRNGQNTDLARGRVRNADAVLLLLNSCGGSARVGDLKAALKAWRPDRVYSYLFQLSPDYGFLGGSFEQATSTVEHYPSRGRGKWAWHESTRRTYYYRLARGVVAISLEGYRRLAELGVQSHAAK